MATYSIDLTKLADQWDASAGNFKAATDAVSLGNTSYTLSSAGLELDIKNAAGVKIGTLTAEAADGKDKPKTLTFKPETATAATTISFTQGTSASGYVLTSINNDTNTLYTYTGIGSTTAITSSGSGVATVLMEGNDVSLGTDTKAVYRLSDSSKNAITIGAADSYGTVNAYVYGQDSIYDTGKAVTGVSSNGKLSGLTNAEVDVRLADNAYRAEITTTDGKAQYWTAAANASAVTMDAGDVTGKTPVTFTLSNAQAAKIVSGRGNDTIVGTANVDSAITYEISRERGEDTFQNVTFGKDDLIIFDNATDLAAGEITVKSGSLYYGGQNQQTTTLKSALDTNGGQTNFSFDKGATKYAVGYGKSIAWSTDKDIYIGDSNGANVSSITGALQGVDLSDTKKYRDIKEVVVGADVAAGSEFKGLKDTATTVDATAATKGIYWYGNTSASGKTTGAVVSLNGSTFAQDTVQFGATEGYDTVYSFQGGFGSTDDILYFDSAASIKDVKLSKTNGADGNITLGAGDASLNVTLASGTEKSDALLMQFSDGVTKKVALETAQKAAGTADTITADGADIVYGYSDTASKNWVQYTAAQTDDLLVNFTTETDKYLNIHNIDASGSAAAITYAGKVGDTTDMTIKTGTGTALVWAAQSSNDSIQIGSDGKHLADVWYAGASDGKDTIGGTAESLKNLRVEFIGVSSLKDLRSSYTTSTINGGTANANVVYTYNDDTKNTLTILNNDNKALDDFTVILDDNADYTQRTTVKASIANDVAHTFSTDTKLYTGKSASVAAGADVTTEQFISLGNGDEATSNPGTDYYFDKNVNFFDASQSNAAFTLVGRGYGVDSTLKGGYTRNLFWGGGHTSDTFYGQEDAYDMVMFGQDDGMDSFKQFGTNDAVYLYDVDDISKVSIGSDNKTISLNNGASVLTLSDATGRATDATSLTFYDANRKGYTYDAATKSFTANGKSF